MMPLRALLAVLLSLAFIPAAHGAWRVDAVVPHSALPQRPLPFQGAVSTVLSDGSYLLSSGSSVLSFGIARYSPSGTPLSPFVKGGDIQFGVSGAAQATAMDQASDGTVWIAETTNDTIHRRTMSGEFIDRFGASGSGAGEFSGITGIAAAPDGTVLVVDSGNNRVQRLSATGAHLATYGVGDSLNNPQGIAVAADGSFYVADMDDHEIVRFDAAGVFASAWGILGIADGQFDGPLSVAVTAGGEVLVGDNGNDRIQRFTALGVHVASHPLTDIRQVTDIDVFADGRILLTDQEGRQQIVLTALGAEAERRSRSTSLVDSAPYVASTRSNGEFLVFGAWDRGAALRCSITMGCSGLAGTFGTDPGEWQAVQALVLFEDGSHWIADSEVNGILRFSPEGNILGQIGSIGAGPGQFNQPSTFAKDVDGSVWVLDTANTRLQHLSAAGAYLGEIPLPAPYFAYGMIRLSDGSFIIGDQNGPLVHIDVNGVLLQSIVIPEFFLAGGMVDLGDGTLLVPALVGDMRIIRISDGSTVERVILPNDSDYATQIVSVTRLADGRILASDMANSRMLILTNAPLPTPAPISVQPTTAVPTTSNGSGQISFAPSGGSGTGFSFAASWLGQDTAIGSNGILQLSGLREGRGTLIVTVRDSTGASTQWTQAFTIDRTAPRFSARSPRLTTRRTVSLYIADNLSTANVSSMTVTIRSVGKRTVRARLADSVGNVATRTWTVDRRPSLTSGPLNKGLELWRPGGLFTPGSTALNAVFGPATGTGAVRHASMYRPALVREVQFRLKNLGYASRTGRSTGVLDRATQASLRRFQRAGGVPSTGLPDRPTRVLLDRQINAQASLRVS